MQGSSSVSCQARFDSLGASSAGSGRGAARSRSSFVEQDRAMAPAQPGDEGQIRGSLVYGSRAAPVQAAESL